MAQRYGGKFSPDGTPPDTEDTPRAFAKASVDPVGARSNVLFVPPIVLAVRSINDGATGLAVGLVAAGALVLGAWLLRDGLRAEAAYNDRKVARRPAVPRKIVAAVLTGAGVALAAWKVEPGFLAPLIYGVAACALHLGAFGLDPMKDKGMEGIDTFQQDRVAVVVDEAEKYLSGMQDAARRAGDREVEGRVERFLVKARELIRTVEEDPRDLTAARKFLGVYLMGARDASVKFADIYDRTRDAKAKADYLALLSDLEQSFGAKTRHLMLDTNSDLTVEIEVLRDRLQREGVRL
ncbi:5-bromo-4-chloroindolyl phosphate hydrolysis family protein [Aestuariicoccus sp. MJ-SS9]|uniref:5-bromo-4-chloroindolyl phosphate hydrolysis family protein n=1 Tax=Aestuariicoccus sp. MJ-SS9 TaxID=3079855 RepID=UPI00290754B8|nr:5-bromo-4-chloroindolyl phosphate hydrolysis family protein [Aestuariicoccus sp. MJ-SS9]MDU8909849.1 5-bromo-4-chloroindolyl phosphate hydrolysis family protein [Aestuariicoccus sp. MJ-SS9]